MAPAAEGCVTAPPLSQFHVGLFARVVCCCTGQLLGDDQLGDVYAVAQQVRDDIFGMGHCTIRVPETMDSVTSLIHHCLTVTARHLYPQGRLLGPWV